MQAGQSAQSVWKKRDASPGNAHWQRPQRRSGGGRWLPVMAGRKCRVTGWLATAAAAVSRVPMGTPNPPPSKQGCNRSS